MRRSAAQRFLPGFHVFPGGVRDSEDHSLEVTAIRECFEETGVLVVPGAERLTSEVLHSHRESLLARRCSFGDVLATEGLILDPRLVRACGRWLTPPFAPRRFDTRFFLARCPEGSSPSLLGSEMDRGEWIDPRAALGLWRQDGSLLAAPTFKILGLLASLQADRPEEAWLHGVARELEDASPGEGGDWGRRIELRPGIFVYPVRSPTLPPATHTNVMVFGAGAELVVVDPGAEDPAEQAALDGLLDELVAEGRRVRDIVITHLHRDHLAGAEHLAARYDAPIVAHRLTRDALRGELSVSRCLDDGDLLDLPAGLRGEPARRLRVVHTPGHARGHLLLHEETSQMVAAGDLVAGGSYVVIDPPEGDMADYLRSLERIVKRCRGMLAIPAHGGFVGDLSLLCQRYVRHRLDREAKVLSALGVEPVSMAQVLAVAYDDSPREMWPLAERSALAHLLKLSAEGRVTETADSKWRVRQAPG
jgi:glyoxylase-like metal-dependent hydrolase (beta-lactamase superfamily II)/8-oxo-dGTP pyrophosphatase MutT (NUDIX family)